MMVDHKAFLIAEAIAAARLFHKGGIVVINMPYDLPDVVCQNGKRLDSSFGVLFEKVDWQELDTAYMRLLGNPRYEEE